MIYAGYAEIPERYVVKRWTKGARGYIPSYLEGYQDDVDAAASRTYRHLMLHKASEEMTRLGNTNPEAYKIAMDAISSTVEGLRKLLYPEEGQSSMEGDTMHSDKQNRFTVVDEDAEVSEGEPVLDGEATGEDSCDDMVCSDKVLPPLKKRPRGRPKVSRYKTGGEEASLKNRSKSKTGVQNGSKGKSGGQNSSKGKPGGLDS
jgi:hypothetical protein